MIRDKIIGALDILWFSWVGGLMVILAVIFARSSSTDFVFLVDANSVGEGWSELAMMAFTSVWGFYFMVRWKSASAGGSRIKTVLDLAWFGISTGFVLTMLWAYVISVPNDFVFRVDANSLGEGWPEFFLIAFCSVWTFSVMNRLLIYEAFRLLPPRLLLCHEQAERFSSSARGTYPRFSRTHAPRAFLEEAIE